MTFWYRFLQRTTRSASPRLSACGRDRKDPIPIGTLADICPMSAIAPSGALAPSAPLSGFSSRPPPPLRVAFFSLLALLLVSPAPLCAYSGTSFWVGSELRRYIALAVTSCITAVTPHAVTQGLCGTRRGQGLTVTHAVSRCISAVSEAVSAVSAVTCCISCISCNGG